MTVCRPQYGSGEAGKKRTAQARKGPKKELPMFEAREETPYIPPCLILAHSDVGFAAATSQALRRLGWDVYQTRTGAEVRRLAGMLAPRLILLGTELPDESGWLT